ncbi:hypothetical protein DXP70_08095 [Listeria monocytogenes]|nr:hypothetical protein [Listeria monocytogenes]MDB03020.1 hypothetical protein [Listeria monocytogenes]MDB35364.1 hypothetical protein [Listeria monocytogenes]
MINKLKGVSTSKKRFFAENRLLFLLVLFALLALIIFPFVLPHILVTKIFDNVVGGNDTWINFWGGYIGTIGGSLLTIILTFLILKYQLSRDNADKEVDSRPSFSVQGFSEKNIYERKSKRSFGDGITKLIRTDDYDTLKEASASHIDFPTTYITILCENIPSGCSDIKITCTIGKDENFTETDTIELNWDALKTGDELIIPSCSTKLVKKNAYIKKTEIEIRTRTGDKILFEFNNYEKKRIVTSKKYGVLLNAKTPLCRYEVLE